MVFHVYVDGVTGTAPSAARAVAEAMSTHYGVPVTEAYTRLTAGAFCVRANVDRATAEHFARDLSALGARVRIEPAIVEPPAPEPAVGRKSTRSALPPQPEGRRTRPSLLEMGTQPGLMRRPSLLEMGTQPGLQPGSEPKPVELGALAGGELSLSMLDNAPPPPRTVTPVAATRAPARALPRMPTDAFLPPLELGDDAPVELVLEDEPSRAPPPSRTATPAPSRTATLEPSRIPAPSQTATPAPSAAPSRTAMLAPSRAPTPVPSLDADVAAASHAIAAMRAQSIAYGAGMPAPPHAPLPVLAAGSEAMPAPIPESTGSWLADPRRLMAQPRIRTATGVALAIMLGFLPADLFASARERSLLGPIDRQVMATQAAADTPESYQALDAYRDQQLAAKRDDYRWIVLEAMLIWAVTGGALGYLWFRKIRWSP